MSSRCKDIMANKSFLPYRMGYLTDWMVKKAKEELNETEKDRDRVLTEFRKSIAKDKDLNCWTDDAYLLQFLRARKFSVKKSLDRLQRLYTIKKNFSDVYPVDFDADNLRNLLETGVGGYLPYRDENGAAIVVFRMANWDSDLYPFPAAATGMTALILSAIEDPATQVCGLQIILDAEGCTLKQIRAVTPRFIQLLSYALRNALPVRFKGIHIVNESIIFGYVYSILKIFLTEKIKKRFHFHGSNFKTLHKHIPKEILPGEYGGDNIHYNIKELSRKEMELFYDRYAEMHHKGYC